MKRKSTRLLLILLIALFAMPMSGISQSESKEKTVHVCTGHDHDDHHHHEKHKATECKCGHQHEVYWKAHPEAYQEYLRDKNNSSKPFSKTSSNPISRFFNSLFGANSGETDADEVELPEKFIIPVVFHVFGDVQSGKLITYDKIEKALQKTNEDFARISVGQDLIHDRFKDIVGELSVEFRLVKIDPNGNTCDGVNFYPAKSGFGNGSGYDSEIQKYAWDNYKYMNVYIMNDLYDDNSYTNSGVAWYPSEYMSKANLARVVYNGAYINGNTDENFRRILTHEFGHFFNLKHTFYGGCEEEDGGDECADTPAADRSKMGIDEKNCKGEYTNTQNFMNYTDDYEMFTVDQVERMTNAMKHSSRVTLWQEENLKATGVNEGFNPQNVIEYADYKLTEAIDNDGSVDSELKATITKVTDVEFKNEAFVAGTHFKVANLPEGLVPVCTRVSSTEVNVVFNGNANLHNKDNSAEGIEIEFLPAAFNKPISNVWNYKVNKFSLRFRDEYETKYITIDKNITEKGDWTYIDLSPVRAECYTWHYDEDPEKKFKLDMEIDKNAVLNYEGTPNIVPLNFGDEISASSSWYIYTENGKQADIYNKNFTEWKGKRRYVGIRVHHDEDIYHGWLSATISADGNTFTVHDGAYYTKPEATIQAGKAHINILKFQGDTIYEDDINNNGSVKNFLTAKLMNCNFNVAANTIITAGTHYSITGLPTGLKEEIKVLPNNFLSVKFNGYAENHNKADFSQVVINFTDQLFDGLQASEIKNADVFTVNVEFLDEYEIVYHDMDDITVDKDNTWKKFIMGESENAFGAWIHKGNLRFETYEKDVVGHAGMLDAKILSKGTSIDANSDAWITPGGYPDEVYITDVAHKEWVGQEGYLGCVINLNGNRCYAWIRLEVDEKGESYTVKDWAYNEQPNAPIIAGETVKSTQAEIGLENPEFVEKYSNKGELDGLAKINLLNDEFTLNKDTELTQGSHFTVKNLPEGLRCKITVVDKNNLTAELTGNALNHTKPDAKPITITLKDILFRTSTSEKVKNGTFDLKIKYKEPWDIIYTDITDLTASESNTFSWFGMDVGTHGFGAWWYNKEDKIKFESYENYVVCVKGTDNLIPLTEGTLIGANSVEWYQGKDYPDEPDLDDSEYHEWRGKEAYVGVRLKNGEFNHYGWIRIAMAADASSYTVLDHAYNDEPEAPIIAGQKLTGDKAILDVTKLAFKERYENDGSIGGVNYITITNGKFKQKEEALVVDKDYSVENIPEGLLVELSVVSSDSIKVVVKGKALAHLASDNSNFSISLKEETFDNLALENIRLNSLSCSLNFRNEYKVVYVDNEDILCSENETWTQLNIIPDLLGVGTWCYKYVNLKLESYDNKLICNTGTSKIKLLKENVVIDANTSGWTTYDKYPNQLDLCNPSYSDWKGKEGYVGVQIEDKGYFFYAWLRISVAENGRSLKLLDYAYNEEPGKAIVTGEKTFIPIKPEVEFIANRVELFQGESVQFTDESKQNPTTWAWSFDGGLPNSSTVQNPEITYPDLGVFDVSLNATNRDGDASLTKPEFITVFEEGPAIANFNADKTLVKTGGQVQFADASLRLANSWNWTFEGGEPQSSTNKNPTVAYNTPGVYKVSLVAENKFGQSIEVKEDFITVQDFSANGYCEAKNVYEGNWLNISRVTLEDIDNTTELSEYSDFTDQIADLTVGESYQMGVSYGTNTWEPNRLFVWIDWDQSKTFEDSERVFYGDNSDQNSYHSIAITVPADAKPGFTLMRLRSAYDESIKPCGIIKYAGEVEDYSIKVTSLETPVAKFISDKATIVKGEKILFSDVSENSPTNWAWEFQGAEILTSNKSSLYVQYNNAGTYQVKLTASNASGSDTQTKADYITVTETAQTPNPDFAAAVTEVKSGDLVGFTNLTAYNKEATFLWTFEGGEPETSTEINPEVAYYFQGSYGVSLSVTTSQGTKTITKDDLIRVTETHKPVADFKAESLEFLAGKSIQFTDLSANNPTSWTWEFEGADELSSNEQNPIVTYSNPGTYKVKLTASNSLGDDVHEKTNYITVNEFDNSGYCEAKNVYENNWLAITNVKLGGIDNTSELSEYSDFTSQCADLKPGSDNEMSITYGNHWSPNAIFVWVDWNQDKTFSESERVYFGKNSDEDGINTFTLTVPNDAVEGYTLMRLRTAYSNSSNPCGTITYAGEVEDYTINVTNAEVKTYVNFTVTNQKLEKGKSVIFSNISDKNVSSILWNFEEGTPRTSTVDNPVVTYEAAGVYDVSLTVTDENGDVIELKSDYITVTEPAVNHKPLDIKLSGNSVAENASLLTVIGEFKAVDEDESDSHTYSFVAGDGDDNNAQFTIDGASLKLNTALDFETKGEYTIRVQAEDAAGATVAKEFTVQVEDVKENTAPNNILLSAASVDENAGEVAVATLSAEDVDADDKHRFALKAAGGVVDADNGKFRIEGDQLIANASFDYETSPILHINLEVNDDKGAAFEKAFEIKVNDVFENTAPTDISLSNNRITENADIGVLVATLYADDVDKDEEFVFELVDEEGKISTHNSYFSINENELVAKQVFDYETLSELNICIKATDKHNGSLTREFTIHVLDVDENNKPTDIVLSNDIIRYDAPLNSLVAELSAVDKDDEDSHSFRLYPGNGVIDADNDKFIIEGNQLKLNADISKLTGKLFINLRTIDANDALHTKAVQIQIKENSAPSNIELSNTSVSEDADLGTVIGSLTAIDADADDTHTFTLLEGDAFIIAGNSLKLNAALDFESKATYTIKVKVADAAGSEFTKEFTINVTDVDENNAPSDIELSNTSVSEDADLGTVIGILTAVDADKDDTHTFTLVEGEAFVIEGNSLKLNAALDFESKATYTIKVKVADAAGSEFTKEFTINVTDVDENNAPSDIELSNSIVSEDADLGTVIGSLTAVDADKDDTHTFILVEGSAFIIEGNSLKLNAALDFESKATYTIKVKVADAAGSEFTKEFTINVTDVDENHAPSNIELSNTSVSEDADLGTVIGSLTAVDADKDDTHTFTLVEGEAFIIEGNSLKLNAALDFESKTTYIIKVKVADAAGSEFTKEFTINVTDVDENHAPSNIELSNTSVSEDADLGTVIGSLTAVDADKDDTHTFTLIEGEAFIIEGNSLKLNAALDFESKATYTIKVKVADAAGSEFTKEFTINVTDVDENNAPSDIELSNSIVSEDADLGTVIGSLTAVDADKDDTHTFTLVEGDAFIIEGNSLKLNAALDFESKATYTIKVKVADAAGSEFTKEFTINVTDVEENHAPTDILLSNSIVSEDASIGTEIGYFTVEDPDRGDNFTFVWDHTKADNDSFSVDEGYLILTSELDFDTKSSYHIVVKVMDEAGASFEKEFTITVSITTGINTVSETEVKVFPNPVVDELHIRCDEMKAVKLYNVIGNLVQTVENKGKLQELKLDCSSLKKGMYLLRIELNNNEVLIKKVIKM